MTGRRQFLALSALAAITPLATAAPSPGKSGPGDSGAFAARMAALEADVAGRLGVAILDTGSGRQYGYRADERFPMCSTFKLLAAAAVLKRVDDGLEQLARRIVYTRADLQAYSPVTEKHVGGQGLSLAQLCEAAVTRSDNTAANLMLASMGGPAGLTAYLRTLGDETTRLDRNEPALNESLPGDPRDTTTPLAMLGDVQRLVLGTALRPDARALLSDWLVHNQTGAKRVRAGLPRQWKVGDKTGTGPRGSTNTVGLIWPGPGAPILFAVYLTASKAPLVQREAVHAAVGRLIAGGLA